MRRAWRGRAGGPGSAVAERIRPLEVPVLTEAKRRVALGEVGEALRRAYPQVLRDLARAYDIEIPSGYSHEEIVALSFTEPMQPQRVFFDQLYRLYAPARFGLPRPADGGEQLIELLRSLYAAEPMWRLYLHPAARPSPEAAAADDPDLPTSPPYRTEE